MSQYGYPQPPVMQQPQQGQYAQNNYYPNQGGQPQGPGAGQPYATPQQQQYPQQPPPNPMYNQPVPAVPVQQQYQQPPPQPQYNPQQQQQQQYNTQTLNQNHPLANPTYNNQSTSHSHSHTMGRGPYIDPDTQIAYPCSNPAFEGYLTKQSMWLKDWRRRYFLLCGSKLFFAKDPYSAPHGMIDLSTATTVKSADVKSRKKNSFEVSTHDMTYLMYADTEKEKDDWIGSVGRSIVRASGTFLTKNDVAGAGTSGGGNGGGADYGNDYGYGDDDDDGVFENSDNHPYFND